jgi:hypothetical protein
MHRKSKGCDYRGLKLQVTEINTVNARFGRTGNVTIDIYLNTVFKTVQ